MQTIILQVFIMNIENKYIEYNMKYFIYILIITLIFIIYVEYSVGSIFFRQNSLGTYIPNIKSLLNFMIHPLYNTFLWNTQSLDINYPFVIIISSLIYYIIL